jgi:hypothetical protein
MQPAQDRSILSQVAPKTIRYCKTCGKDTPHEILSGAGCVAKVCIPCLKQTESRELDRD